MRWIWIVGIHGCVGGLLGKLSVVVLQHRLLVRLLSGLSGFGNIQLPLLYPLGEQHRLSVELG
jgi:hypothetical protein